MARDVFMHKQLYKSISTPVNELSTLVFNHFGKAPMGWTGIDKLTEYAHTEQFVNRIFGMYDYLKDSDKLLEGINPSQFYKIIYKFQLASKSLSISPKKIQNCYYFLANYAIRLYNYNVDCIQSNLRLDCFTRIENDMVKRRVALLSALLRSYSETVYCDEHTIAGEIYSPLYLDERVVIGRCYSMLDASALRDELIGCPVKNVRIFTHYGLLPNTPKTDIVGNLLITDNILPYMDSFYIEVTNDKGKTMPIDISDVDRLVSYFGNIIPELSNNYKEKTILEKLWMKVLCEYYALKPYCVATGIDWRPNQYEIDIDSISSTARPIVCANEEICSLSDESIILKKLIELNDPRVHY